jgi:hypothetical protein
MLGLTVVCEGGRTEHGPGPPPAAPAFLGLTEREVDYADPGAQTIAEGTESAHAFANSKQLLLTQAELAKFAFVSAERIRGELTEEDIRGEIPTPQFDAARKAHQKRAKGAERALSDGGPLRQERKVLEQTTLQAKTKLEKKAGEQITSLLQGQAGYTSRQHDAPVRYAQDNAVLSVAGAFDAAVSSAEPCFAVIRTETSRDMLKHTGVEVREAFDEAQKAYQSGRTSRWRVCHSADALSPSRVEPVEGGQQNDSLADG